MSESKPNDFFESTEEMVELARKHYSADFPNDQREGCPPSSHLATIARSGRLPDEETRQHLFSCSECFNEFRQSMQSRAASASAQSFWHSILFSPGKRRFALVASVTLFVIITVAAVMLWRTDSIRPAVTSENRNAEPVETLRDSTPAPPIAQQTNKNERPAEQIASLDIDLEGRTPSRDASGENAKPISLRAIKVELDLKLAEGSPRGSYRVVIKDARGKILAGPVRGKSPNGRALRVVLDLRNLSGKKLSLCLMPERGQPYCYDMVIAL